MKIRGVIFDFNGVLVDDYSIQKEAWSRISVELRGIPVSTADQLFPNSDNNNSDA